MSQLESTLERLGPPPPEVCLDWAWQLVELVPEHASIPAGLPNVTSPVQLAWSDMDCDQQGVLRLKAQPTSAAWAVDDLLRDVYYWAGSGNGWASSRSFASTSESQDASNPSAAAPMNSAPRRDHSRPAPSVRNGENDRSPSGTRSAPKPAREKNCTGARIGPILWQRRVYLAAVVLGLCSCLLAFALRYPVANGFLSSESRSNLQKQTLAPSVLDRNAEAERMHASDELPTQIIRLAPTNQETAQDASALPNEPPPEPTWTELGGFIRSGANTGAQPENSLADPPNPLDETALPSDAPNAMPPATSLRESLNDEIDVTRTVNEITRRATAVSSEAEVTTDGEAQDNSYNLPVQPIVQKWKLPNGPHLRTLKPTWRVRLNVGCEGFAVEPARWQTVALKSVTSWSLSGTGTEASALPRVAIQVRQVGTRGPSLQWSIAAISEEAPRLVLPLAPQRLEPIAGHLGQLQQRLQSSLGEIGGLLGVAGVPSSVQASLRAQRKDLQAQLDMASEMVRFVALVQQLASQLEGNLEIDAEYFDGAVAGGPVLLTLGRSQSSASESPDGGTP